MVGIGGTGAKCVEAAVHLSAAGLLPDKELYTLFVDPDRSNGNLERAKVTLDRYVQGQKIRMGTSPLFQTDIRRADPSVWSPFVTDAGAELKLKKSLSYSEIRAKDKELAGLFDVLYSDREKEANLTVGFRGHPSIGAAVMAQKLTLDDAEPWKTFRELVENDTSSGETARVFICGSVFGGTGAAGLPTIGKLVRQELSKGDDTSFEIACGLVLPYFSFEGSSSDDGLQAEANSFVPNTQSALQYYWDKRHDDIFDGMYVVGDPAMSPVGEASVGGPTQKNAPHFIELIVALSAADFFQTGCDGGAVALMSRESHGHLRWEDLPYPHPSKLRRRLSQLANFAFAYLSTYKPALDAIRNDRRPSYAFPWFVDLVKQQGAQLDDDLIWRDFEVTEEYAEHFLLWLAELHSSAQHTDVALFDCTAFSEVDSEGLNVSMKEESGFRRGRFGVLDRPERKGETNQLARLWARLSSVTPPTSTDGAGSLLRALHDLCDPEQM